MEQYDIAMIGHICRDVISEGAEKRTAPGGAVFYSSIAAVRSGARVCVLTKAAPDAEELNRRMEEDGVQVELISGPRTTSMECIYLSENKERRNIVHLASAEPYNEEDLARLPPAAIYHVAGLVAGEFPQELLPLLKARGGKLAMDVQTMIRHSVEGRLEFSDWEEKERFLPLIDYLKTDAAEAEILTGLTDRRQAARRLADWGCREVMITHNSEVLVLREGEFFTAPFTAKSLEGRSGRGDTTFAAYMAERTTGRSPAEALAFAAALCSIKMEKEGPFRGGRQEVLARLGVLAG